METYGPPVALYVDDEFVGLTPLSITREMLLKHKLTGNFRQTRGSCVGIHLLGDLGDDNLPRLLHLRPYPSGSQEGSLAVLGASYRILPVSSAGIAWPIGEEDDQTPIAFLQQYDRVDLPSNLTVKAQASADPREIALEVTCDPALLAATTKSHGGVRIHIYATGLAPRGEDKFVIDLTSGSRTASLPRRDWKVSVEPPFVLTGIVMGLNGKRIDGIHTHNPLRVMVEQETVSH